MYRHKKGQSVTEYAILLGVAIAVFAGMQTFVKRGFQAKIKTGTDAMTKAGTGSAATIAGEDGTSETLSLGNLSQYEPYYNYQKGDSYSESKSTDTLDGSGKIAKASTDLNVQAGGAESGQRTANTTDDYNGSWK